MGLRLLWNIQHKNIKKRLNIKMKKTGRKTYVPEDILFEVRDIKREDRLPTMAEAFRKMVKYSQVGREAKRIYTLDWSRAKYKPKKVK